MRRGSLTGPDLPIYQIRWLSSESGTEFHGSKIYAKSRIFFSTFCIDFGAKLRLLFLLHPTPSQSLPRIFHYAYIRVLKSWPLRMYANVLAYSDKKFATWDAMVIGRLHCSQSSWENASVKFLKSGGFIMSALVGRIMQRTLVLWGADDKVPTPDPYHFMRTLPPSASYIHSITHTTCIHLGDDEDFETQYSP